MVLVQDSHRSPRGPILSEHQHVDPPGGVPLLPGRAQVGLQDRVDPGRARAHGRERPLPGGRARRATCPPCRRTSQPCCGSPPGSWRSGPSGRRGRPSLVYPVLCQGARSSFLSSSGRRLAKVRAQGKCRRGRAPCAWGRGLANANAAHLSVPTMLKSRCESGAVLIAHQHIRLTEPGERARPIVRNDCGCHYRWPGWVSICEEAGIIRSMSRKGSSPDNSRMEGFFGTMKNTDNGNRAIDEGYRRKCA